MSSIIMDGGGERGNNKVTARRTSGAGSREGAWSKDWQGQRSGVNRGVQRVYCSEQGGEDGSLGVKRGV